MNFTPQGIKDRHAFFLRARRLVGEEVDVHQDARDVLLSCATHEVRYRRAPFAAWVGLDLTPDAMAQIVWGGSGSWSQGWAQEANPCDYRGAVRLEPPLNAPWRQPTR